jgi:hypothetical protein
MVTGRQVDEMVARCVSCLVYYRNIGETPETRSQRGAEVRAIATWARGVGLKEEVFLRPVEAELIARYGPEVGTRLAGEVARAFKATAATSPIPSFVAV